MIFGVSRVLKNIDGRINPELDKNFENPSHLFKKISVPPLMPGIRVHNPSNTEDQLIVCLQTVKLNLKIRYSDFYCEFKVRSCISNPIGDFFFAQCSAKAEEGRYCDLSVKF